MSGTIIKKISGKRYLYFEYYDGDVTKQKYCGPEGSDQSKIKALAFEYEHSNLIKDPDN